MMIKIISNPYLKEIVFQEWDDNFSSWIELRNTNSRLLTEKIKRGFFSFVVNDIIKYIIAEYGPEPADITIVFEGAEDEWEELEAICRKTEIKVICSGKYLENARDIFRNIKEMFDDIKLLANKGIHRTADAELQNEFKRFSDAANDAIPICVFGNYSSGKSTFINALIGYELLPSSDDATTARIYRIEKSHQSDKASVKFGFNDIDITILLSVAGCRISGNNPNATLAESVNEIINRKDTDDFLIKLHDILCAINSFTNDDENAEKDAISDLIEVSAPIYQSGVFYGGGDNFVIFDTPGSNSASKETHYQVLKNAMESMSNGLPIFVSTNDTLDSNDSLSLCNDIINSGKLDARFTMIIINKADQASLPKDGYSESEIDRIKNKKAITRQLYSGGIFYVSSILGLGAKTSGRFNNYYYASNFSLLRDRYSNPSDQFYNKLYSYDILPGQMKEKYDQKSSQCSNLLYSNSGLCSVENAIYDFGDRNSLYDKSQQSQRIIREIIRITSSSIEMTRKNKERDLTAFINKLDSTRKNLLEALGNCCEKCRIDAEGEKYEDELNEIRNEITPGNTQLEGLGLLQEELEAIKKQEKGVDIFKQEVNASLKKVVLEPKSIKANFSEYLGKRDELKNAIDEAGKESSSLFFDNIRQRFNNNIGACWTEIEEKSQEFMLEQSRISREALSNIVTGSQEISEEKRNELNAIIMAFAEPELNIDFDSMFVREKFLRFGSKYKYNISKLVDAFKDQMTDHIDTSIRNIRKIHSQNFDSWLNRLYSAIRNNIDILNPELQWQNQKISELEMDLAELGSVKTQLEGYLDKIDELIGWKGTEN